MKRRATGAHDADVPASKQSRAVPTTEVQELLNETEDDALARWGRLAQDALDTTINTYRYANVLSSRTKTVGPLFYDYFWNSLMSLLKEYSKPYLQFLH